MSVTEYVGPIVAPHMEGEWSSTKSYESLAMVIYEGNTYTARQDVPVGVQITNNTYWVQSGNYNAQIENYRTEVRQFDSRITQNDSRITQNATDIATNTSNIATNATNIASLQTDVSSLQTSMNTIAPFDATPTSGSAKGVTSDGIFKGLINPTIDPYYYGADPTGTTDSTAAIQACIDANNDSKKVIFYHSGTYKISNTINIPYTWYGAFIDFNGSTIIMESSSIVSAFDLGFTNVTSEPSFSNNIYTFFKNVYLNVNSTWAIRTYRAFKNVVFENVDILCANNGIQIANADQGTRRPSDVLITNSIITRKIMDETTNYGIFIYGTDSKFMSIRIYAFTIAIEANSTMIEMENAHILAANIPSNGTINNSVAIHNAEAAFLTLLYVDTMACIFKNDNNAVNYNVNGLYYYSWSSTLFTTGQKLFDFTEMSSSNALYTPLKISNSYISTNSINTNSIILALPQYSNMTNPEMLARLLYSDAFTNTEVSWPERINTYTYDPFYAITNPQNYTSAYWNVTRTNWVKVGTLFFTRDWNHYIHITLADGSTFTFTANPYSKTISRNGTTLDVGMNVDTAHSCADLYIRNTAGLNTEFIVECNTAPFAMGYHHISFESRPNTNTNPTYIAS